MELSVFVTPGATFDIVELAEATRALGGRLRGLAADGVDSVHHGDVPAGARPVDAFAMGSLLVVLAPTAPPAVVGLVARWLAERPAPAVRMVIDGDLLELGGASRTQQRRVAAFLRRHGG